jgi:hypothetical protein
MKKVSIKVQLRLRRASYSGTIKIKGKGRWMTNRVNKIRDKRAVFHVSQKFKLRHH